MNFLGCGEPNEYPRPTYRGIGGSFDSTFLQLPVRESEVLQPSDMIGYGDTILFKAPPTELIFSFFAFPYYDYASGIQNRRVECRSLERRRHGGFFDVVFSDGHVESLRGAKLFSRSDDSLKRWNRDNLPHADLLK